MASLNKPQFESVFALGRYNRQAVLLFHHTDEWFHVALGGDLKGQKEIEAFWGFFIPYYQLWGASVYVVHEGLHSLDITDAQLNKLRQQVDMDALRRFRNATFHFQTKWRDPRHEALIGNVLATRKLFERQDFLVRKMMRLVRSVPNVDLSTVV